MAKFPEDLSKLDSSAATLIDQLERYYNAMTQYQRDELSVKEKTRYEAILAVRKDLGDRKSYTLTVQYDLSGVPAEDKAGLEAMIKALQDNTTRDGFVNEVNGNTMMAKLYSFNYASGATMNKGPDFEERTTAESAEHRGVLLPPVLRGLHEYARRPDVRPGRPNGSPTR